MVLRWVGRAALAVTTVGWVVMAALMLRRPVFASHDTMISYAHVWYVSRALWHGHGIPFHMPALGSGAFTFPYASVPWITAAVARPLLGDRTVTLWLIIGAAGAIASTFVAFPELRSSWWATLVLLNPAILYAALNGQLVFLWALAALLLAIAAWRANRQGAATALAAVANVVHPAIVLPLTGLLVLGRLPFERHRISLVVRFIVSAVIALPAVWIVTRTSVYASTSTSAKIVTFIGTMSQRASAIVAPIVFGLVARRRWAVAGAVAVAMALIADAALYHPLDVQFGVRGLRRAPDTAALSIIHSSAFEPGATYRYLRASDAKLGMYELLEHGARLDSDFFPEGMHRSSFANLTAYCDFLRSRRVDFVVVFRDYNLAFHTNEQQLASRLVAASVRTDRFAIYPVGAATVPGPCPSS